MSYAVPPVLSGLIRGFGRLHVAQRKQMESMMFFIAGPYDPAVTSTPRSGPRPAGNSIQYTTHDPHESITFFVHVARS